MRYKMSGLSADTARHHEPLSSPSLDENYKLNNYPAWLHDG